MAPVNGSPTKQYDCEWGNCIAVKEDMLYVLVLMEVCYGFVPSPNMYVHIYIGQFPVCQARSDDILCTLLPILLFRRDSELR